jgi:hypothetical protein
MNYLKLCILFLLGTTISQAQTFHAILVADTRDPMLGSSCEKDLLEMSARLKDIAQKIRYQYNEVIVSNDQFGESGLTEALNRFSCSPQDAVFFYYTGHGLNTPDRVSTFPLLYLKGNQDTELEAIHLQLKSKKPKFCVTIGDCCNNLYKDTQRLRSAKPLFRGLDVTRDKTILQQLFLETEGDVLISSAERGQKATAHPSLGSFYTNSWIEALSFAESYNSNVSWETLLKDAENRLQEVLKELPDTVRHRSHWVMNYSKAPALPPSGVQPVVSFDEMNKFLNTLADEKIPFQKRNELRLQKQDQYFASAAVVEIYIKSPDKPIEQQSIGQFLKRIISTARIIERFNFVERKSILSDDGKYRQMTLQEVR